MYSFKFRMFRLRSWSGLSLDTLANQWSLRLIALGVLLILVCTLYPFRFHWEAAASLRQVMHSFQGTSDKRDAIANVILFLPLGFGLAGWRRRSSLPVQFMWAIAVSAALSSSVELLQVFIPSRNPSYIDMLTNTLGGGCGCLGFQVVGPLILDAIAVTLQVIQRGLRQWRPVYLWAAFWSYLTLTFVVLISLYGNSLAGWDAPFPLRIGGDHTSGDVWQGRVSQVQWYDRALSPPQVAQWFQDPHSPELHSQNGGLMADYGLQNLQDLSDHTGRSPTLRWQAELPSRGMKPSASTTASVPLSKSYWLQTSAPLTAIQAGIQRSSQFTLAATLTSDPSNQGLDWFKTIISLGDGTNLGHVSVGQFTHHLVAWVQTSASRRSGGFYQVFVGNTFTDAQPHRLLMTYRGFTVRIYIDGTLVHSDSIVPELHTILGGLLIFAPLSFLLSAIANSRPLQSWQNRLLIGTAMILPPVILESGFAAMGDRPLNYSPILLALMIMIGTFFVFYAPAIPVTSGDSA